MAKAESETVEWAGWEHICGHSQGSCSASEAGWARSAGQAGVSVEVSSEADTRVAWHGTRWWCTPLATAREVSSR